VSKAPAAILITGGEGQVGLSLQALAWPEGVRLHAPSRQDLDVASGDSVAAIFERQDYACVINCGAYTAVDRAETEVAQAFAVNALGPALLADATRAAGIPLLQVSTDYVFDGLQNGFYREDAATCPISVYGASKLAGELATRLGNPRSTVLRTAWVVSPHRSNFLKTMLRLAQDRDRLDVVADQTGCPTSAKDIAGALQTMALRMMDDDQAPTGVFHFVNAGSTTWAGLARHIFAAAEDRLESIPSVNDIATTGYPTPARRPTNSKLDCSAIDRAYGIQPRPWQAAVTEAVKEVAL
jgi:dTDP-4-dehydrorhamnose reductase